MATRLLLIACFIFMGIILLSHFEDKEPAGYTENKEPANYFQIGEDTYLL